MNRWTRIVPAAVAVVALVAASVYVWQDNDANAADHTDPPGRITAGDAADIGDLYAWHGADGNMKMVLTFAGPAAPVADQTGTWDADVLYGFHVDTDPDDEDYGADANIWVRFGQNDADQWGMQVTGIPGTTEPIVGAVETMLEEGDVKVWAGLREDPFFFDLQGFQDTLATGDVSFDNTRDTFAGANITAIVIEFPSSALGSTNVAAWATTGRISE